MFPAVYAGHLVDVAARFGVEADELLEPFDFTLDELRDGTTRLEVKQVVELVERARALTGEPALGVYLGLAMRASWHGYLGFAVLTARDLGDALKLGERFFPTRTDALSYRVSLTGCANETAVVTVLEHVDFGPARDVIVLALLIGLSTLGHALTGRELDGRIEVALPRPDWLDRLAHPRLARLGFDRAAHRLVFDAELLRTPFQLADAAAKRLAAEQCEKELAALSVSSRVSSRVRALVLGDGGVLDVEAVAKALAMSVRTLKRRLASEGTSYSDLLDQERRARAEQLLATERSVKEIAAALGFADTAAFSHAFTRWTGRSPSQWRADR
ncbi:MAG: AraC family transcriptional regulator ligand-binding domain-containing protein [Myxococcota bacterium]